jgi:hypothetical protein
VALIFCKIVLTFFQYQACLRTINVFIFPGPKGLKAKAAHHLEAFALDPRKFPAAIVTLRITSPDFRMEVIPKLKPAMGGIPKNELADNVPAPGWAGKMGGCTCRR